MEISFLTSPALRRAWLLVSMAGIGCGTAAGGPVPGRPLPRWERGSLDIRQIYAGTGDSAFFILSDGTTLFHNAASVDRTGSRDPNYDAPQRPDVSVRPGQSIASQIRRFPPMGGALMLIYQALLMWQSENHGMRMERFEPGRADQIVLRHTAGEYLDFEVRNIASGGYVWTGGGTAARNRFPGGIRAAENNCSTAIRPRYGGFTYFNGGDLSGQLSPNAPAWTVSIEIGRIGRKFV